MRGRIPSQISAGSSPQFHPLLTATETRQQTAAETSKPTAVETKRPAAQTGNPTATQSPLSPTRPEGLTYPAGLNGGRRGLITLGNASGTSPTWVLVRSSAPALADPLRSSSQTLGAMIMKPPIMQQRLCLRNSPWMGGRMGGGRSACLFIDLR